MNYLFFFVCSLAVMTSSAANAMHAEIGLSTRIDSNERVLYNGIRLPDVWPPTTENPADASPMRVPYLENPPEVIPINVGRQLFVDDFLIETTTLQRVFHRAKKYEGNPVFRPETPQELNEYHKNSAVTYLGQGGVFYDPAEEIFKMFYTAGWRGG